MHSHVCVGREGGGGCFGRVHSNFILTFHLKLIFKQEKLFMHKAKEGPFPPTSCVHNTMLSGAYEPSDTLLMLYEHTCEIWNNVMHFLC